ncbi:MAG: ABC transporter ATP-binding protein [Chloroflexota bacterium]|nr:ABC transporter ATP-binding protein [Chloroflexota bacterium]NOG66008.1 ABC transporter ATP-binding protein [Chloroflexota bacterium]GIK65434.1 MAG: ABC transporter ATP-binding protein [Chloroflexota bacterium]
MSKLEIDRITYTYWEAGKPVLALQDLSLALASGEFVTLIGPSGSGKSTLLELIVGLLQPDSGQIRIHGQTSAKRLGKVAYMPQQDALLPWRTVLENVILAPEVQRKNRRQAKARARELMPLFGLDGFADAFPAQLSGGMRQRAAFLRTVLAGQDILLLDEPFGALDALTRRELQDWLLNIWQHFNYTILFVTHDVEEAIYLADRVLVLSQRPGKITQELAIPFPRPRQEWITMHPTDMIALETQLLMALRG